MLKSTYKMRERERSNFLTCTARQRLAYFGSHSRNVGFGALTHSSVLTCKGLGIFGMAKRQMGVDLREKLNNAQQILLLMTSQNL